MRDLSKFLPTADMQADFEKFQSLSPEERAMFQEERARKMESMPGKNVRLLSILLVKDYVRLRMNCRMLNLLWN